MINSDDDDADDDDDCNDQEAILDSSCFAPSSLGLQIKAQQKKLQVLDKTLSMMMFYSKGKWAGWMLKDAGAALNKSKYLQMSTKTIMLMIFIAHVHIIDNS